MILIARLRKGFTFVELTVVMGLFVLILGVSFFKFRTERLEQRRELSRVDRQQAVRRFLMWFRQDMQSMDQLIRFRVVNIANPDQDSQVIEVVFDRFVDETEKQVIHYRYDLMARKLFREVEGQKTQVVENIANFQLKPFNFERQRIRRVEELANTYYFEARVIFSENRVVQNTTSFHEMLFRIYPKLKSALNKAGFNEFHFNQRFQ
jgi:type II secretory pathway pseudopilin PulG